MSQTKSDILRQCLQIGEDKCARLQGQLDQLHESLTGETKSTAGDKHETSRAKLHFEIDQLNKQLNIVKEDIITLRRCQNIGLVSKVSLGGLVETTQGRFLVACGWGKVSLPSGQLIYCISTEAPFYQSMKGLAIGEQFKFNNNMFYIENLT